ncbi:MAG: hypothetical protein ABGX16_07505 [Pirellulales bacterium]
MDHGVKDGTNRWTIQIPTGKLTTGAHKFEIETIQPWAGVSSQTMHLEWSEEQP